MNTVPEPQLIEQTAHSWGGSFFTQSRKSFLQMYSTCLSILNIEESLREEVGFALSTVETVGLQFLEKHGARFGWERGAGTADSCSTGR